MKITDIKTYRFSWGSLFIKVETDEGVSGWGECSPMNSRVIQGMIEHSLKSLIVGMSPLEAGKVWDRMFFPTYKLGVMGVQPEAMAGIDIALWDISGKVTGLSVSTLLGGRYRDKVPMYASIGGGADMTPQEMAQQVERFFGMGFRAFKIRMDWGAARQDEDPDKDLEMFRLCRNLLGDETPLSFDANNGYTVSTAIRQGRKMEEMGLYHFEEPVAQYDYAGIAQVADALDVPVSAGEHEYTRWQFRDLILQGRVDIVQPDVVKCAGISEMRHIATLADAFNKGFVPHQTQPTLGTAANLHVCASLRDCTRPQEYTGPNPKLDALFKTPLTFEEGSLTVPNSPGIGLEVDEEAVRKASVD